MSVRLTKNMRFENNYSLKHDTSDTTNMSIRVIKNTPSGITG